ncbi:MAG: PilZ domain-containing protein [Geobacteraceae bacterium]|nr:PilZ domain-containing protein [Geobacteraceae bacterium]
MSYNRDASTTILLICREGISRHVYQAQMDLSGVALVCVQGLMEFFRSAVYCPLNGIMVDMPTYLRSSDEEKRLLTDLVAIFPALRLKCHEPTAEIRTLSFGTEYPGTISPAVFIRDYCIPFVQRRIRTSERSKLNLPALLKSTLPVEDTPGTRSVTASLSREGCFLISFEPWDVGERGWIVIPGLKDSAPIPVEVCWNRAWGGHRLLPGMGVRFLGLTESQKIELSGMCGQNLMQEDG